MQEPQEMWVWSLGQEYPLEKGMAIHSSILAREIPWTEEPGGLQSMGSQKSQTQLSTPTEIVYISREWSMTLSFWFSCPTGKYTSLGLIPSQERKSSYMWNELFFMWRVNLDSRVFWRSQQFGIKDSKTKFKQQSCISEYSWQVQTLLIAHHSLDLGGTESKHWFPRILRVWNNKGLGFMFLWSKSHGISSVLAFLVSRWWFSW